MDALILRWRLICHSRKQAAMLLSEVPGKENHAALAETVSQERLPRSPRLSLQPSSRPPHSHRTSPCETGESPTPGRPGLRFLSSLGRSARLLLHPKFCPQFSDPDSSSLTM